MAKNEMVTLERLQIYFLSLFFIGISLCWGGSSAYAQEVGEPAEAFTFSEASEGIANPGFSQTKKNAVKVRTAPVSSSGTFDHELSIDVPPGRLKMTPTLSLRYTSGAAKKSSAVGAGWTFGPRSISRSTRDGYPQLTRVNDRLLYDDDQTTFETPLGRLVSSSDGPTGVVGKLYSPLREKSPVRYEYRSSEPQGGMWIEHDPEGVKRYYGSDLDGRSARIVNESGTHSWLLLLEVDVNGNHITYDYHNIGEQSRTNLSASQATPVLKQVSWGGNRITDRGHAFKVTTLISEQEGDLDMLGGHLLLTSKIDVIQIQGPSNEIYWSYSLSFEASPDTGRLLLTKVTRIAPAEDARTTIFTYTKNDPNTPRFSDAGPLPPNFPFVSPGGQAAEESYCGGDISPLDLVYAARLPAFGSLTYPRLEEALSPRFLRSGYKIFDFNADGKTDILYHPSGLSTPSSRILFDQSFLGGQIGLWTPITEVGSSGNGNEEVFGLPSHEYISTLGDVDGDFDLDGISFPIAYNQDNTGSGGGSGGSGTLGDVSDLCCDPGFWNHCGNIDPLPQFGDQGFEPGLDPTFDPRIARSQAKIFPGIGGLSFETRRGPWRAEDKILAPSLGHTQRGLMQQSGESLPSHLQSENILGESGPAHLDPSIAPLQGLHGNISNGSPVIPGSIIPPGPFPDPNPPDPQPIPEPGPKPIPDPNPRVNCLPFVEACHNTVSSCGDPCDLSEGQRPTYCRYLDGTAQSDYRPGNVSASGTPYCGGISTSDLYDMPVSIFTNQARNSTPNMNEQQQLSGWPANVVQRAKIKLEPMPGNASGGYSYKIDVLTDFLAPITDINADGRGDVVLLKYLNTSLGVRSYKFLPRAYLAQSQQYQLDLDFNLLGDSCSSILGQTSVPTKSEFSRSLVDILADGKLAECKGPHCTLNRKYPNKVNFNTFLMDVNADGLTDLVVARPPVDDGNSDGRSTQTGDRAITSSRYSIPIIQKYIAEYFRLSPKQLQSKSKAKLISHPRELGIYLAKTNSSESSTEIGKAFGGMRENQVTLIVKKIEKLKKNRSAIEE